MTSGTASTARRARLSPRCRMVRDVGQTTPPQKKKNRSARSGDLPNARDDAVGVPLQLCFNFGLFAVNALRQQCVYVCVCVYPATDCLNYVSPLSAVLVCARQIPFIFLIFRHLSLAPDRAPTILSVTPHTTTSVLVRWQVR